MVCFRYNIIALAYASFKGARHGPREGKDSAAQPFQPYRFADPAQAQSLRLTAFHRGGGRWKTHRAGRLAYLRQFVPNPIACQLPCGMLQYDFACTPKRRGHNGGMPNTLQRFSVPGRLTPTSWSLPASLSYDDWLRYGQAVMQMGGAIQWALGDWWVHGGHAYGERIDAVRNGALSGGYTFGTLMAYGRVARKVETRMRIQVLSFQHHQVVAALPPAQQKRWLARAVRGERDEDGTQHSWSVSRLRQEIKAAQPRPPQEEEQDDGEEEYVDTDYLDELMSVARGAREWGEGALQRLEQHPGATSTELIAQARSVVEVWSTVLSKLEENHG
jgi:hypothetical protein